MRHQHANSAEGAPNGQSRFKQRPQKIGATASFIEEVPVAAFFATAASAYGPARFADRERRSAALDKLIATHAIALDVILVPNNKAAFALHLGLTAGNWVKRHRKM
jgi:tRNA(fMet)-specific endonuclease VapC